LAIFAIQVGKECYAAPETLVMVSELDDEHGVTAYLVDKAVLIIDTPRPIAGQGML